MTPDQLLVRFYRTRESRAAARAPSSERGSFSGALEGERWWTWACLVHHAALHGLPPLVGRVLELYYLSLTPAHETMLSRRGQAVVIELLSPAQPTPPPDADLRSYTSWRAMALALAETDGPQSEGALVDAWRAGREAVGAAMEARPYEAFKRLDATLVEEAS